VNEDNVDLNRNFHDFSKPLPSSTAYEAVHDALVPLDWDGPFRLAADAEIQKYIQKHGQRAFQAAVSGGQYSRPNGLFFGGTRETWSNVTFRKIMSQLLTASTEKIAVLDLHTGLGPSGYGEPIYAGTDLAEYLRAIDWFGPEVTSTIKGDSSSARVSGSLADAIYNSGAKIECTFLAIECGTVPVMQVLTALRADNWLHANAHQGQTLKAKIKKQILDAFYVDPVVEGCGIWSVSRHVFAGGPRLGLRIAANRNAQRLRVVGFQPRWIFQVGLPLMAKRR
jgi:Protein of unknown function (DUF2817)